jgi:hypothetical protein
MAATDMADKGRSKVMDLKDLSDQDLLDGLGTAMADIVMFGQADPNRQREAWERVVEGIRDLERRYPPEQGESA